MIENTKSEIEKLVGKEIPPAWYENKSLLIGMTIAMSTLAAEIFLERRLGLPDSSLKHLAGGVLYLASVIAERQTYEVTDERERKAYKKAPYNFSKEPSNHSKLDYMVGMYVAYGINNLISVSVPETSIALSSYNIIDALSARKKAKRYERMVQLASQKESGKEMQAGF